MSFFLLIKIKINNEKIDSTDSLSLQTIVSKVSNMFAIVECY